jgi:hypothetical protein
MRDDWKPAQTRPIAGRRLWFALRPGQPEDEHDAYTYATRAEAQDRCDELNAEVQQ